MFGGLKAQQTFYNLDSIQTIEIIFTQQNWDFLLDTAKHGSGGYLMAESVTINGVKFDSVGVRYKGNSSYDSTYKKNPFNISLDEYKSQNYQGVKTIKLANCFSDPSMLREILSYSIVRNYMDAPRANYAKVYVNGDFVGLYANTETINKQFCSDRFFSSNKTFVSCSPFVVPTPQIKSNLQYLGSDSSLYFLNYEIKSSSGWNELVSLCDSLANYPASFENVIDADRVTWMLALNSVLVNLDSYSGVFCQNYYLYKDATGRFNPIMWDFNMSFGGFPFAGASNTSMGTQTIQSLPKLSPAIHATDKYWPLINIVMNNPRYKRQYFAHLKTIMEEIFASEKYKTDAEFLRSKIRGIVKLDLNKFFSDEQFEHSLADNISVGSYQIPGIETLMNARMEYLAELKEIISASPQIQPVQPNSAEKGQPLVLTAKIENALPDNVFAGVRFSKEQKFEKIQMYDDGMHGDGTGGDLIFGCKTEMKSIMAQYYFYAENNDAGIFSPQRAEHEFYTIQAKLPSPKFGEIVINEFLASNTSDKANENDSHEDWIELYNTTDTSFDLYGTFLSDKFSLPQKFMFPENSIIPAKGYLTVWADENDATAQFIHTNFKLSASGEQIIFSASDGAILDSITFGTQTADISMGRCPNGTGEFKALVKPAFNTANDCLTGVYEEHYAESGKIEISPNPAENSIRLHHQFSVSQKYTIISTIGEIVADGYIDGETTVSTAEFPVGMYALTVGKQRVMLMIIR